MTRKPRVLLLSADLLFASRVQGQLAAAGEEVELIGDGARLRARLEDPLAPHATVLVVDLTDERLDGVSLVQSVRESAAWQRSAPMTLGFYSHVDAAVRERAELAGFDLVVARSRMAREGAALVAALAARSSAR